MGQINGKITGAKSRFAKAGVSCFYDSEVLNSCFVHLIKFSAEKHHLRVAVKHYGNANRPLRPIEHFNVIQLDNNNILTNYD
jgi:hypothetical protein